MADFRYILGVVFIFSHPKLAPKLHFPFQYVNSSSVCKNFDGLNQYLGFQAGEEAEFPTSTGKAKVVRKKAVGDWRHWFTEEDVELFKPSYLPYWRQSAMIATIGLSVQIL